eukprot:3186935-Amphidinium_carterae.1
MRDFLEERELLAARVAKSFQMMDLDHSNEVRLEEWLHYSLLLLHPPGHSAKNHWTQIGCGTFAEGVVKNTTVCQTG